MDFDSIAHEDLQDILCRMPKAELHKDNHSMKLFLLKR